MATPNKLNQSTDATHSDACGGNRSKRDTAIILAAHGAGDDSAVNKRLCEIAEVLARDADYAFAIAAFQLGTPSYTDAFARVENSHIIVVPVLTNDGYYRRVVLPRALLCAPRPKEQIVHIAQSIGTHPRFRSLAAASVQKLMATAGLFAHNTSVVVVGHGTKKHADSRLATQTLAKSLARQLDGLECYAAFLDAPPLLDDVPRLLTKSNVILLPHLIGGGYHANDDIQKRLGIALNPRSCRSKQSVSTGGRWWYFAPPLMEHPEFLNLISRCIAGPLKLLKDEHVECQSSLANSEIH